MATAEAKGETIPVIEMIKQLGTIERQYGEDFMKNIETNADAALKVYGKGNVIAVYLPLILDAQKVAKSGQHADAMAKVGDGAVNAIVSLLMGADYVEKAVNKGDRSAIVSKIESGDAQKYNEMEQKYKGRIDQLENELKAAQSLFQKPTIDIVGKYLMETEMPEINELAKYLLTQNSKIQVIEISKLGELVETAKRCAEYAPKYKELKAKVENMPDVKQYEDVITKKDGDLATALTEVSEYKSKLDISEKTIAEQRDMLQTFKSRIDELETKYEPKTEPKVGAVEEVKPIV